MGIAGVIDAERRLSVVECDAQPLGDNEVRVDVAYCGLCGSDVHMFLDSPEPLAGHVLGHEFSGVISQVGPDVADWEVGTRVVICPVSSCGECTGCHDEHRVCVSGLMSGPGMGRPGGLAESVTLPTSMLHRVPDELSLRSAALTEPLAVAVRGVGRSRSAANAPAVVIGAGPIGLLTVAVLRARGTSRVLVAEPNAERRNAAARMGALTTTPEMLNSSAAQYFPDGVSVAYECSGHPDCLQHAVGVVDYGARIVILGIPGTASPVSLMAVAVKEISIVGSLGYSARDFAEALTLLSSRSVEADSLITSVIDLDRTDAALRDLASGASRDVKVLVAHRDPDALSPQEPSN